jgi:hypothetical protein
MLTTARQTDIPQGKVFETRQEQAAAFSGAGNDGRFSVAFLARLVPPNNAIRGYQLAK